MLCMLACTVCTLMLVLPRGCPGESPIAGQAAGPQARGAHTLSFEEALFVLAASLVQHSML